MVERKSGLSLDFIIHPGETIKEAMSERNMNQDELAMRTGFSPKHVSEVVNGKKGISPKFAKSLEYVLGMPASFWINLQGIYDKEILEYREQEEIDERELDIAKSLKPLINYAEELGLMDKTKNLISQIIQLRSICKVNDLRYINDLVTTQAVFRKSEAIKTNSIVLYVWLRICELISEKEETEKEYSEKKLIDNIPNIKKCMFLDINVAIRELKKIFLECGIIFQVVKNFTRAPVQGFIKKNNNNIVLSMTIRGAYADIFWFTLFHEIGHLLNGDMVKANLIDYTDNKSEIEDRADEFARKTLIDEDEYKDFLNKQNFTENSIISFANKQNVKPFIIVGRLQKDLNNFKMFNDLKEKYKNVSL